MWGLCLSVQPVVASQQEAAAPILAAAVRVEEAARGGRSPLVLLKRLTDPVLPDFIAAK